MNNFRLKICCYGSYVINLFIATIGNVIYCIKNPRALYQILFAYTSVSNELYRKGYSRLKNFEETFLYQKMKQRLPFARVNYYNLDSDVIYTIENMIMANIVYCLRPNKVFEIGTYSGISTMHFAYNINEKGVVYTLDLPNSDERCSCLKNTFSDYIYDDIKVAKFSTNNVDNRIYKNTLLSKKIIELFGDSKDFDFSPYYKQMDLIFIDGCHAYDFVKSDTENAFKMLSEKGVIIWHDCDYIFHNKIFQYIRALSKEHNIYSIANTRFAICGPGLHKLSNDSKNQ